MQTDHQTIEAISLFLCGDVMTGRGIDQILPHPVKPILYEPCVTLANTLNSPRPHTDRFRDLSALTMCGATRWKNWNVRGRIRGSLTSKRRSRLPRMPAQKESTIA
jgi:hypothetical protein